MQASEHGRVRAPSERALRLRGTAAMCIAAALLVGWAWPRSQGADAPASERPGGAEGWVNVRHGHLVDGAGREVVLRGFNVDALTDPRDAELGRPAALDDRDAALMAESGFDVVRLPIAWSLLEPERGHFDYRYLARVVAAARLLERHELRVVLDMHFGIGWGVRSEVPAWATLAWVPDWRPVHTPPWSESVSARVIASQGWFWLGDWQSELARAWQLVAGRFAHDPMLAGYDLYNEPRPLPVPPGVFDTRFLFPFFAAMISRIARTDPNHLFIVESPLFDGVPTIVEHIDAPNVVYSPHLYVGSLTNVPLEAPSPSTVAARVRERQGEARAMAAALWFGEVGFNNRDSRAPVYETAYLHAMAPAGAGWCWWQWRQDGGWGIRSSDGTKLDRAALRRLARPYLQAAPSGTTAHAEVDGLSVTVPHSHSPAGIVVGWPGLLRGAPRARGSCLAGTDWTSESGRLTLYVAPGRTCTILVRGAR